MAIATFSPPLKATAIRDSLPRIVIGVEQVELGPSSRDGSPQYETFLLAVDGEGRIEYLGISEVTVDWRYDPKTELWSDVNGAPEDPLGDSD